MPRISKYTIKNNWKPIAAGGLTVLAGLVTGLTCAFFPPAIPAIAGISIFGTQIFAGLSTMSVASAAFSAAGIGAAATLIASALINAVTKIANLFDNLFRTKKTHITDFPNEIIIPAKGPSPYNHTSLNGNNIHKHGSVKSETKVSAPPAANQDLRRNPNLEEVKQARQTPFIGTPITKDMGKTTNQNTFYQEVPAVEKTTVTTETESTLLVGNKK